MSSTKDRLIIKVVIYLLIIFSFFVALNLTFELGKVVGSMIKNIC